MKKHLQLFLWSLLFGLSLLAVPEARASHILGGDLTYTHLGTTGNTYRVKFRFYRDCSGDPISGNFFKLNYRNTGCNGTNTVVTMTANGGTVAGSPYCATGDNSCSHSNPNPNYDVTTYQADVNLPPGVWTLAVNPRGASRPNIANLTNLHGNQFTCTTADGYLYVEATLDNTNGIVNNSPQFDPQDFVVQYVGLNQPSTITYSATEADGDSLAYELVQPLDDCGVPVPYAPYNGTGNTGGVIRHNGCTVTLPPAFTNFSLAVPIPVALDTIGVCPNRTAVPSFYFNATARTVTFTPNHYVPNSAPNCGYNKYQLVMKITEYRRINGVRHIVGTVRREGVVIILSTPNHTPSPPVAANQTTNSGVVTINRPDTLQASVYAGSYSRVRVDFTDPDAGDLLTVTYPLDINTNPSYLNNVGTFTLTGNHTTHPVGTFILQPLASAIGSIIRINLRAEDGSCPVKGVQNRVLIIRVLGGSRARIAALNNGVVTPTPFLSCTGAANLTLNGSILRPDTVTVPAGSANRVLQNYTYAWSAHGNGLNAAQATNQSITVSPTTTTRYFLKIKGNLGFSPAYEDTASVLVRVAPTGVNSFDTKIASTPFQVVSPSDTLALPPATFHFKNTSAITAGSPDFRLDSVKWTYQRLTDGRQAITETPVVFWTHTTQPPALTLKLPGQYRITLHSAVTLITSGTQTPAQCPVTDATTLVNVLLINNPNIITPNGDGLNDVFRIEAELAGSKLQIYNRWGRKVEEFSNYNNDWSAQNESSGTYYYAITDTKGHVTKGWVEVVKDATK